MARKKTKTRKGYFYEDEEQAVLDYIASNDKEEKNEIFKAVLLPAFTKMIESIIRRYKLYLPDELFEQTFDDTISYLLMKINNFKQTIVTYEEVEEVTDEIKEAAVEVSMLDFKDKDFPYREDSPEYIAVEFCNDNDYFNLKYYFKYFKKITKHYKAYSYCGTVCKNYLIAKNIQFVKDQQRNMPYDSVSDSIEDNENYSTESNEQSQLAGTLIENSKIEIRKMIDNREEFFLTDDEVKVGTAICELFDRWEELIDGNGSNKLQKSSVLYFLREQTMMETKTLRDNMKKFKKLYYNIKEKELN